MTKIKILTSILILLAGLLALSTILLIQEDNFNQEIQNNYSYTKAICDDKNFCQDYLVECDGNQLIEVNPITGAWLQLSTNWQDSRNPEVINNFCELRNKE